MNKPVIKNKIKSLSERKNVLNNTNNFISGLKLIIEGINNDYFRIPDKFYAKPLGDVDASWMADYDEYEDAANDIEGDKCLHVYQSFWHSYKQEIILKNLNMR